MSDEPIRLIVPEVGEQELRQVGSVLASGHLTQGPVVEAFEEAVARYVGVTHAIATTSATTALHLALVGLGVGRDDEVIVADFTFPATSNVVVQQGARPVLVDVDPTTLNVRPEAIRTAISPRTRAIMPVHTFGRAAAMEAIVEIAGEAGVPIVEDAACALGTTRGGRQAGTFGLAGCFSFHPRKAITTGEGGMVVTDDPELAVRLRRLRTHGGTRQAGRFEFTDTGFNYRLSDILAAVGLAQMDRIDEIIAGRRERARMYDARLADLPDVTLLAPDDGHVYQSYVVRVADSVDRDQVIANMRAANIETTIGTYAVHAQPVMGSFGYRPGDVPESYRAYRTTLTLPLHLRLDEAAIDRVVDALRSALRAARRRRDTEPREDA